MKITRIASRVSMSSQINKIHSFNEAGFKSKPRKNKISDIKIIIPEEEKTFEDKDKETPENGEFKGWIFDQKA